MTSATATNSNSKKGLDEPLTDPTNDLLDVDQHARALANYIREQEKQLPFTVGIFGEWGEGKTTMVGFLEHHLRELRKNESQQEIKFVTFSAWPFTTSEKLWRALILKIAKVLFPEDAKAAEEKQKQLQEKVEQSPNSWWERMSHFLSNDFFPPKEPPTPLTEYEKFLKKLEETDFGRISKRTPTKQVNQEAMMSAVVNGALTVLGTMSPLVSGLRGLFGSKIDVEQINQAQTDESSTEAVEALPSFRKVFGEMLDAKTEEGEAVYVFIDDLDRAQPDVALDIMESIRIALNEVRCVFIIAVDETLISQGLRLRYRELFAEVNKAGQVETLANKGQEYLEKIIQFRTRVPPRTAEQTKRLIAAEFPYWTPAGDIIQTIANNNPRRIKQYCQRLSFQNDVGSTFILGSAGEETETAEAPETDNGGPIIMRGSGTVIGDHNVVMLPGSQTARPDQTALQGADEMLMLSQLITTLNYEQLRKLFLMFGQSYIEASGAETADKAEIFVAKLSREGKLLALREAIRSLDQSIRFPDEE